jgi:hypothetical protein
LLLLIITSCILILIGALIPWRRFARNEVENELRVVLKLILKVLRLVQYLISHQNDKNDREFEKKTLTSIINDTLNESERQMLKGIEEEKSFCHFIYSTKFKCINKVEFLLLI